jgi:hypothetical protein
MLYVFRQGSPELAEGLGTGSVNGDGRNYNDSSLLPFALSQSKGVFLFLQEALMSNYEKGLLP